VTIRTRRLQGTRHTDARQRSLQAGRVLGMVLITAGLLLAPTRAGSSAPPDLVVVRRPAPCSIRPKAVAQRRAPSDVQTWAHHERVIGGGALWAVRSGVEQAPKFDATAGMYSTKVGWYLRPAIGDVPQINGRRLDGEGTFRADANPATDASGTRVASDLQFSSPGCWEVTARYRSSKLKFRVDVPRSQTAGANPTDQQEKPA
jgi:hypothetical protein